MAVIVKYNGEKVFNQPNERFSGVAPSFRIENENGYLGHVEGYEFIVHLKKTECDPSFESRHAQAQALISRFLKNFGRLEIIENDVHVVDFDSVIIRSINIPQGDWGGYVPVRFEIDRYRTYKNLGVINPVDEVSLDSGETSVASVTRRISAQGVGPNGLRKAKEFVNSTKNQSFYFSYLNSYRPLVKRSERENVNHLTGEYSLEQTFAYDTLDELGPAYVSVLTYRTEISEEDGETTVAITGDITGDISGPLSQLKSRFDAFDFDAIAQSEYNKNGGTGDVHPQGSRSVTESPQDRTVSFSLSYSSKGQEGVYIDDTVVISKTLDSTCITYSGVIKSDSGGIQKRWQDVQTFFSSFDKEAALAQKWQKFGTGDKLSPTAQTISVGRNESQAEISFSLRYCTNGSEDSGCLENFQYVLNFRPEIDMYGYFAALEGLGCYVIQDLGWKRRPRFEITGSVNISRCCTREFTEFQLKNKANFLSALYFNRPEKYLEKQDISYDESNNALNFSFLWNAAAL